MRQVASEKKNILIADDDSRTREFLSDIFGRESYEIELVSSGIEIFKKIARKNYHLLVLDVNLPDANGYEISGKITKNIANKPKILLFTVNDIANEKELFRKSGADALIQKGISIEEIEKTVEKLLALPPPSEIRKPRFCEYTHMASENLKVNIRETRTEIHGLENAFARLEQQHKWLVRDFLEEKQRISKNNSAAEKLGAEIAGLKKTMVFAAFVIGILLLAAFLFH